MKNKYSLSMLCVPPNLAKSSYYYQGKAIHTEDKYPGLRKKIIQLFHENCDIFGYRKIHMLLRKKGTIVSEKAVRRIMKQEALGWCATIHRISKQYSIQSLERDYKHYYLIIRGSSPDNSACEGFFGHFKTEMFYGHNWDQYSVEEFIHEIDDYMNWYCQGSY